MQAIWEAHIDGIQRFVGDKVFIRQVHTGDPVLCGEGLGAADLPRRYCGHLQELRRSAGSQIVLGAIPDAPRRPILIAVAELPGPTQRPASPGSAACSPPLLRRVATRVPPSSCTTAGRNPSALTEPTPKTASTPLPRGRLCRIFRPGR